MKCYIPYNFFFVPPFHDKNKQFQNLFVLIFYHFIIFLSLFIFGLMGKLQKKPDNYIIINLSQTNLALMKELKSKKFILYSRIYITLYARKINTNYVKAIKVLNYIIISVEFTWIFLGYSCCLTFSARFLIWVQLMGRTFWTKCPKTAWKLQNQHFWCNPIFWVVTGSPH